jgi:hypothetical protein
MHTELKTLTGELIKFAGDGKAQTLKDVALFAVLSADADKLDGPAKYQRYEFAKKIQDAEGDLECTVEEVTMIKDCIGKVPNFGIVVVGAAYDILEGKNG